MINLTKIATAAFLAAFMLLSQAEPIVIAVDLPERITPLTKEQILTKVPHFHCFNYGPKSSSEKRCWIRHNDSTWIERYSDGMESKFKVLGHATVKDTEGAIVLKISGDEGKTGAPNDGGLQAFIPDKGSKLMHHWYRNTARGDEDWNDLAEMNSVE